MSLDELDISNAGDGRPSWSGQPGPQGALSGSPPSRGALSSLPRIDSGIGLDQMAQMQEAAPAAHEPSGAEQLPHAGTEAPRFALGARVQVDFDDEGWFGGVVESHCVRDGETFVYSVRLDDGETADDVEGSEIRSEILPTRREIGREDPEAEPDNGAPCAGVVAVLDGAKGSADGDAHGTDETPRHVAAGSSSSDAANTREDALSEFELRSELAEDTVHPAADEDAQTARAECRMTASGVEWSFVDAPGWSSPTAALLKAHEAKFPRWREVAMLGPRSPMMQAQLNAAAAEGTVEAEQVPPSTPGSASSVAKEDAGGEADDEADEYPLHRADGDGPDWRQHELSRWE